MRKDEVRQELIKLIKDEIRWNTIKITTDTRNEFTDRQVNYLKYKNTACRVSQGFNFGFVENNKDLKENNVWRWLKKEEFYKVDDYYRYVDKINRIKKEYPIIYNTLFDFVKGGDNINEN